VKNWDKTRCFVRQRKVIYGKGVDNILGTGEGDIVSRRSCTWVRRVWSDWTGEDDKMGQENLYMGQESLIGWDRRRLLDGTGEVVYGSGEFARMGQEKMNWWDRKSWCASKQDNFLAKNVPLLLLWRQLVPEF
jgi:hypothetical protein